MKSIRRKGLFTAITTALLLNAFAVSAQDSDDADNEDQPRSTSALTLDQLVVTARKREETLQDVPFSIAAQTEENLRNIGAVDIEDVSNAVAGFSVQDLGPGQSQISMRGVSAGQIVRDQPGVKEQVGVYLDESVISLSLFTPDLDLFDLNRVEVLRGPQGTLFGSGSLSGTVRYITNQPNLDAFEAFGEVTGNFITDGGFGSDLKAVINAPLGDADAALRVSAYYTNYGGYIDAVQPNGVVSDVNDGERMGLRAAVRFEPNERLVITPRVIYQDVDVNGFNRIDIFNILANPFTTTRPAVTLGEREQFTQLEEKFTDEFLLIDTTVSYEFDNTTLTSVTSYTDRDVLVLRDATQLTGSITAQPNILNQPEPVYTLDGPLDDSTTVEVLTQELRLSGGDDRWQWVVGGFYSSIERQYGQSLDVSGFEAATGIPTAGMRAGTDILFFSDIPYDFDQLAFFGEATYLHSDRLNFTAGVRYFDFEETRSLTFDGIFAAPEFNTPAETTSDGFSPRVMLNYNLNNDVQINAQISKGFRLGGINDPLNAPLCSPEDLATFGNRPSFEDEELWNYEIGAKSVIMGGRGTFNVAAFYMDISDLQATLDAGTCSSRIIFNVPEARSVGVELELFAQPTANFDYGISASWVDAELKSTVTTTDAMGNSTVVAGIQDGNRLPTTPEFQASVTGNYNWFINDRWEGFVTGLFQHVGDRITQIGDQAPGFGTVDLTITPIGDPSVGTFSFDPELPSYNIANLRVGARNDTWEIALFVNNLTDERAFLALDRERGGRARVGYLTNQPRTVGVTTRFRF